jgi:adenine phosphoribosyltransferase
MLESGEKYSLRIPGLDYAVQLPYVRVPLGEGKLRIASFDLLGLTRLNRDLGVLLAGKLKPFAEGKQNFTLLAAAEKSLQLAQVVAEALGLGEIAVAHGRPKPHMEPDLRPLARSDAQSVTSGGKTLYLPERSISIVNRATGGVILLDDVISTGSTMLALATLVEEAAGVADLDVPSPILAYACAAVEGEPVLSPIVSLARLPAPVYQESA